MLANARSIKDPAPPEAVNPDRPEPVEPPVNILLVDDDPRNLAALEATLESPDYRLVRAETADDALRALITDDFALLMLDVRMPEMNGLELAQVIKQRKKTRHLPIIFLTAYYQEDEQALQGYDAGAVDYMAKPFNPGVLRSKVAVFVELYRMNRALQDEIAVRKETERRLALRTSEVQQLVGQLRALALELSKAEQRERRRLAKILHDHMQQLLVSAKMQLSVLKQSAGAEPTTSSTIKEMESTIEEALAVSRSVTVELSPPVLDQAGLTAALEWLGDRLEEKYHFKVNINAHGRPEPASEEERFLLFECARELLFNAVKHSGVTEVDLELSTTEDHRIKIVVEDKGNGFDRNRPLRAKEHNTSFGLFSVQQRLAHLGGELQVDSAPGQGARITVLAPTHPERPVQAPANFNRTTVSGGRPARRGAGVINILIVDDHTIVRQSLANLLRTQPDINILGEAGTGEQAVRLADELVPDVILMDVNLGETSGLDVTKTILAKHPDIKVIGLSMHIENEVAAAMHACGAVAYVSKGIAAEDLISVIRNA